ncbi:ABC-type Mn2+/Zn2+ transport system permease subunit [Ochrobactrum daejeonense]|uniref:ABC-type Mn2+/Zn2+ transport system permease subunit n=1 Tax=Brucella daejeonensis TaxID=659015 RepID=A0A7W9B1F8_9HYPH|nr:ABC-type Mn2+/Zn2+ transport system permease subunit [Brucella daejeonensis]
MLRKFVLLAIFIATTFGVSGMINGWPKTAIACGVIVLLLMIIFFVFENLTRRHSHNNED